MSRAPSGAVTGCRVVEPPTPTAALRRLRATPIALGALSGLLITASLPPWGWWPLAPIGVAVWLHALDSRSRLQRFAVSWAVGVSWFGPSTLWMWGLTPPGYVLGTVLFWGPVVGAIGVLTPGDRRRLVALPAAIVAFEWFHSHAPFGGVPLSLLSMGQTRAPLLPIATIAGSLALSAAVVALGVIAYQVVVERSWKEPLAALLAIAVLVGAGALWPTGEQAGELSIAIVQGGGPQGTRFSSGEAPLVFQRHLEATRAIPDDADVDLVLWPENAVNVDGAFSDSTWSADLAAESRRLGATLLVGIVEDAPGDPDAFLNYVIAFEPDGRTDARYDKERRVPFGEYVPLRALFEPFAAGVLPTRDQVPGEGSAGINSTSGPFAVAISWEIFFSRRVREGVRDGGQVVLNPTNGSSYWLTQIQTQQLAASALRAAESGRWVLQAAPTGFSAVFDQNGKVRQQTSISEQQVLFAQVPRLTGTTPAQQLGDLPALLLAALALLLVGRPRWRSVRDLTQSTDHPR